MIIYFVVLFCHASYLLEKGKGYSTRYYELFRFKLWNSLFRYRLGNDEQEVLMSLTNFAIDEEIAIQMK